MFQKLCSAFVGTSRCSTEELLRLARTYRRSTVVILEMDLEVLCDEPRCLYDEESFSKYRVTCDQLDLITGLVSGAEVFNPKTMVPHKWQ